MGSLYKIRDATTGLFSTGGYSPRWVREGKTWPTMAQVEAHLKLYCRGQYPGEGKTIPDTWEIVEFRLVQISVTQATMGL